MASDEWMIIKIEICILVSLNEYLNKLCCTKIGKTNKINYKKKTFVLIEKM